MFFLEVPVSSLSVPSLYTLDAVPCVDELVIAAFSVLMSLSAVSLHATLAAITNCSSESRDGVISETTIARPQEPHILVPVSEAAPLRCPLGLSWYRMLRLGLFSKFYLPRRITLPSKMPTNYQLAWELLLCKPPQPSTPTLCRDPKLRSRICPGPTLPPPTPGATW